MDLAYVDKEEAELQRFAGLALQPMKARKPMWLT